MNKTQSEAVYIFLGYIGWWLITGLMLLIAPHIGGDMLYFNLYSFPTAIALGFVVIGIVLFDVDVPPISTALGVLMLVFAGWSLIHQVGAMYDRAVIYKQSVVEVQKINSNHAYGYKPRFLPYLVAEATLKNEQGDLQGTELVNVTYISDPENGDRWTGIADGSSWQSNVKGVVVLHPSGEVITCAITLGPITHGNWLRNVSSEIRKHGATYYIDPEDAYGDCVDGKALVIIPLQKTKGYDQVRYPAGIAVFDSTGLQIYENNFPENVHGPVYPISLAIAQRESLTAGFGFWKWLNKTNGYEALDDTTYSNSGNQSEFNLALNTPNPMGMYYITPVRSAGSSQTITADVAIQSDTMTAGQHNQLAFARYQNPREGLQTLADNLRAVHRDFEWASGLYVMEIIPGIGDSYIGYVGNGTQVVYLFTFNSDRTETYIQLIPIAPQEGQQAQNQSNTTTSPSGDICTQLWSQLQSFSQEKNLPQVLTTASKIVESGCK